MHTRLAITLAVVSILLSAAHVLAQVPNFQRGQVLRADELNRIVNQVNENTDALRRDGGTTHAVACPSESIARAMSQAHPGDTIAITGTCNENVVIDKDGITLDGGGTAVINGAGANAAVIGVTGHRNVVIRGLTVRNGHHGVFLNLGAAAMLEDVTALNNRAEGTDRTGNGVRIQNSSSVQFAGAIVAKGNSVGIMVTRSSSLGNNIGESVTVHATDNAEGGITVYNSSSMVLYAANLEVTGNDWGLTLDGSSCTLSHGNAIFDDNRIGVAFLGNSECDFYDVSAAAANNTDDGLLIHGGSEVVFDYGSSLTINNNGGTGAGLYGLGILRAFGPVEAMDNGTRALDAWQNSFLQLTDARISGNNYGIVMGNGSILRLSSSIVTDNNVTDIFAGLGSIVGWQDSQVGTVDCDASALVRDDAMCP